MTQASSPDGGEQPLVGFMSNDEWDVLLCEVNDLVVRMEALPAGETRAQVFRLLDGIDAIHREALRRLVRLFKEGVLDKVISDPAIHTLMELYDLLPESAPPTAETAAPKSRFPTIPIRPVSARPAAPPRFPHWLPVLGSMADLAPGATIETQADELPILLCRHGDELFALESRCARDGASLRGATLSGYTLTCPNHMGCHYDVRQGSPIGGGDSVACHPVRVEDNGHVLVGLDMDFTPRLPAL
jgi:nitrite reductase/ring-hydroxylating ferredoxin subunit